MHLIFHFGFVTTNSNFRQIHFMWQTITKKVNKVEWIGVEYGENKKGKMMIM